MVRLITYTPTPTNRILVRKLQHLVRAEYRPLDEDITVRCSELTNLKGPFVHIWGDGEKHHESYFVTRGWAKFKANVDRHADRADARYVDYGSHMGMSENNGIGIETQINCEGKIIRAIRKAEQFGQGEVGLTIDLDGVNDMPVLLKWFYPEGMGINPTEVADMIDAFGSRLFRMDIGGLMENLPDFNLIDVRLGSILELGRMHEFMETVS